MGNEIPLSEDKASSVGIICAVGTMATYASIPLVLAMNVSPLTLAGAAAAASFVGTLMLRVNTDNDNERIPPPSTNKLFSEELNKSYENIVSFCIQNKQEIIKTFTENFPTHNQVKYPPIPIELKQMNCWAINGVIQYIMLSNTLLQKLVEQLKQREELKQFQRILSSSLSFFFQISFNFNVKLYFI